MSSMANHPWQLKLRNAGCTWVSILMVSALLPILSTAQNRYDILITEFMSDPSPSAGLPETEFIELKNRSHQDVQLRNWKISNGNSSATIKSDYVLKADSFLILCSNSSSTSFSRYGAVLGISPFPSLNNDAGEIILSTDAGKVMHAVRYDQSWYGNELKAAGGWSLEMIDPDNPCLGQSNWTASISSEGGTPGYKNSVDAKNRDPESPSLISAFAKDSVNLILFFDEAVDSTSAASASNYQLSDAVGLPENTFAIPPFFDQVSLHLQNPLNIGKIYTVTVQHLSDCSGNEIGAQNVCKAGLAGKVKSGDVIFNEILFNPPPYGYDYVELFNRSSEIISCSGLFLAARDATGNIIDPVSVMKEDRAFFPGEYLLMTEKPEWILKNYPMAESARIISLSALPSMPDDQGKLVLLDAPGEVVDELDYDHHWHAPLLSNESGVALERIRSDRSTDNASNWTSAAASAGYGTPGYKNSESTTDSAAMDFISVDPKIFSPDQDGYHDFCFINYQLPAAGYTGSISVYDINGRMVRKLVNNTLWGTSGTFRWDGLDETYRLLPMGHYVLYIELFLPDGTIIKKKFVCVLARRK